MIQHYQQPEIYTRTLYYVNIVFTAIFTLEQILRIIALRHQYICDKWNIFDFIIVLLSLIGKYSCICLHETTCTNYFLRLTICDFFLILNTLKGHTNSKTILSSRIEKIFLLKFIKEIY